MPSGKSHGKSANKSTQQLLFSEALQPHRSMAIAGDGLLPDRTLILFGSAQDTAMEHILQEIMAVGHWLEGLDSTLTAETKSIRMDIAGFQKQVTDLEQCVTTVESRLSALLDREQELLFLCSKAADLEGRS
ncbi:hypothetical protein NDU88_001061 [Pleurodeles waltl]|uniref:Uncharacterized protein n=1 Tax=Pleurodeles waltl TaxID=8319 RepID=A0AAV7WH93_PLEWA|nr:hypothetical protein NDU88_001061 [Pleurodeles waltl]